MFATAEIMALQEKKRQLLLESEINRRVLALEYAQLKPSLDWRNAGVRWLKSVHPAWMLLAPLAGFLLARSFRSERGWISRTFACWRWMQKLLPIWHIAKGFAAKS